MNVLSLDERVRVTAALVEGNSMRATARLTGIDRGTIGAWGITLGTACDNLHRERVNGLHSHLVQLDEIWTFVHTKERRRKSSDPDEYGDQFTFVGIDANAKLVLSYKVGKRTAANTVAFANDLRSRIIGAPQVSTDGFVAYRDALEQAFGARVHHGVAVKLYEDEDRAEHRYAPGRVTGIQRTRVSGSPIDEHISTSYIERQNLTMRQSIRRFTRLTNGFSKRLPNLCGAVALHFAYYNWCRVHQTIRVTPAMQAGLTDHVWSIAELIEIALTAPEPSNSVDVDTRVVVRNKPLLRIIRGGKQ